VKLFSSVPLLICALFVTAGAGGGASNANAERPGVAISGTFAQDSTASATVSGNWQMSWTAGNGNKRQATMQIKQDGSKLSGAFQVERGSAPLAGSLQGNQVSISAKTGGKKQSLFHGHSRWRQNERHNRARGFLDGHSPIGLSRAHFQPRVTFAMPS
jgi:hypothetical protein